MKNMPLPVKYVNLLTRNGIDVSSFIYRVSPEGKLEIIRSGDNTIIISRKGDNKILIASTEGSDVLESKLFDFINKDYLKEIVKQIKNNFVG
jgi:hypothetical protein